MPIVSENVKPEPRDTRKKGNAIEIEDELQPLEANDPSE
jgi:hypothetical protein